MSPKITVSTVALFPQCSLIFKDSIPLHFYKSFNIILLEIFANYFNIVFISGVKEVLCGYLDAKGLNWLT